MRPIIRSILVCLMLFNSAILIAQQIKPEIIVQQGHTGEIKVVAFSPDGKFIASSAYDNIIKLWNVESGKELKSFIGHAKSVDAVAFSPDGKQLISGGDDNYLTLWDVETGMEIKRFSIYACNSVAFSPNGKTIVAGCIGMQLFDVESGKEIRKYVGQADLTFSVAFSPDGKYIVSGAGNIDYKSKGTAALWDVESGKLIRTFNGHSGKVSSVAFSPDGKNILTGTIYKASIIWDAFKGKKLNVITEIEEVSSVAYSPDGKYFISGTRDGSVIHEVSSGAEIQRTPEDRYVNSVAFSPDGTTAISASNEALKLWNVATGKLIRSFTGKSCNIASPQLLPDGKSLALATFDYGAWNHYVIWDIYSCRILKCLDHATYTHLSPDGETAIYVNNNYISGIDLNRGQHINKFNEISANVNSFAFSPDGKTFLTGLNDKTIKLWDNASGGIIKTFTGNTNEVGKISFSPDGKQFASIDGEKILRFWDIESGKETRSIDCYNVFSTTYSPDGKSILVIPTVDMTFYFWDIANGSLIKSFKGHSSNVNKVKFLPNGKTILSCSDDKTLKLWDVESGKEIKTFAGHTNDVEDFTITPDSKMIISESYDRTIKLWDIASGQLIYTAIFNFDGTKWLVYDNEGYWDSSPNGGDLVAMVQGTKAWNIDQFAIKNNRPDLILKKLPNANPELIQHYYTQFLKRTKKLNLKEDKLANNYETPETKITKTTLNGKYAKVDFSLISKNAKITHYNIFVNDVPIYGAFGKVVNGDSVEFTTQLELVDGNNKIEVSCMNDKGVESYRALTYTNYTEPVKKDLYLLAFGVSKYQNSTYNLAYADKDVLDLSKVIESYKGKGFANVYTKVLTNEQVTPEAIKAAKDFVKDAKVDDTFILFIAGHGMHDKDAEATYYYLTSNADVNNLKATAADFETIEDLLQGIPPRNKLFLMDACESGEIDEEDQGQMLAAASGSGMASRGFKTTGTSTALSAPGSNSLSGIGGSLSGVEVKRPYLYQKDRYIYNDLVRRSGAIVFSSSKGGELSYERSDIENGLFTEYIMKALTTVEADKDANGFVSTDELRLYVSEKVAKASGDLQHPTVDRDNIYQKFGF